MVPILVGGSQIRPQLLARRLGSLGAHGAPCRRQLQRDGHSRPHWGFWRKEKVHEVSGTRGRPGRRVAGRVPPQPGGGAARTFRTPERPAAPGISLAPGLLTSPRQPGIKGVLPARAATESAPPALAPALQLQAPPPRLSELSPMARAATPAAPRALRLLGAALLLLLLVPAGRRAAGETPHPQPTGGTGGGGRHPGTAR